MTPKSSAPKRTSQGVEIDSLQFLWALLCSTASIDSERNNISLFNVIEQFNLPSSLFKQNKPISFPHELVISWKRTLGVNISDDEISCDLNIKTIDSSGKILQEVLAPFKFPKGLKRLRIRVQMPGIVISSPGDYVHEISVKFPGKELFKKVGEVPFEVLEQK